EFSDLIIVCEGVGFKVHKVVICPQVPAFYAACTSGFQQYLKETFTGVYEFEEESHIIVMMMIDYLYTRSYDTQEYYSRGQLSPVLTELQLHARVFALADKYLVPGLRSMSVRKFKKRLGCVKGPSILFNSMVLELLESLPDVFNKTPEMVTDLKRICLDYANVNFAHVVRET
ncbi:hypothetical protein N7540_004847, partial [Penicillium herquei]